MSNGKEESVLDGKGKLTDEQLGKLHRKFGEVIKRINEGVINYENAKDALQFIIVEGKSPDFLKVITKTHEIREVEHLIDCNSAPYVPEGFAVENHKKSGMWRWNPNISFYLSKEQKRGDYSIGKDLRKELEDQPVLNANVLEYLLDHSELIPESWKSNITFFWGTIYCNFDGDLFVRGLYWDGNRWGHSDSWNWGYRCLVCNFSSNRPAALAS